MIMNMVKFDPFREPRGSQNEMTGLFAGVAPSRGRDEMASGYWIPSVDIFEDKVKRPSRGRSR